MRVYQAHIEELSNQVNELKRATSELRDMLDNLSSFKVFTIEEDYEIKSEESSTSESLGSKESKTVLSEVEEGYLVTVWLVSSSDKAELKITLDNAILRTSIEDAYNNGLIGYNPRTFWMSRGDSTYSLWLTPVPYLKYFNKIEVSVINWDTSDITYRYSILRYRKKE